MAQLFNATAKLQKEWCTTSTAAKESSWVKKEWKYGIAKKGKGFLLPIVIEGPPIPPPPEELSDIHFGDSVIHFIDPA